MAEDLVERTLSGRYRISREIGRGGMATVYHAQDLKHNRDVALKVLHSGLSASIGADRFIREIAVTARLDHPHILPLLDSGESDGVLYYVMPYVEGESLRARLKREKQLPIDDALRITREVADALSYAHSQGIIHRDIKPENILLTRGHARVADFGIARAITAAGSTSLTASGLAIGTPIYMSPEQATGADDVDARADIYSLGCVLYEMLAGQPPYSAATAEGLLARKLMEPIPSVRIVRDSISVSIEEALSKALARTPADRFPSAEEFASSLARDSSTATKHRRGRAWMRPANVAAASIVALTALFAADTGRIRSRLTGGQPASRIESLAVLPLENLSGDSQQDYLAAGMHEGLILDLGKLRGLKRVSARSSVLRYQKSDKTPREIARELGVDALIAGTVTRSGDRVKITAHLINGDTEERLWSDGYERDLRDVLSLQDEIVSAIAREVQLRLSPAERATLATARQVNPKAYEAYLKGKFQMQKMTPEGFDKGISLFNEAIAIDPQEPLAYAGLAQAYTLSELFNPASSPEVTPRAKAAALKAVQLDNSLAEAHLALAFYKGSKELDGRGAQKEFQRALELNPNLPDAHIQYSWELAIDGSPEEAIAEMKRGVELDPLSPVFTAWLAGMYWEFNRVDDAITEANKALELQPDFPVAMFVLGLCYLDKGQHEKAIDMHRRAAAKYPKNGFSWILARTYALSGDTLKARHILRDLENGRSTDIPHPWFVAAAYESIGEKEKAINWLEKGYNDRILFMSNLARPRAGGATFGSLRGNPRFERLLRRLNLQ